VTDLFNVIAYEQLFDLDLLHPVTDEPVGVVLKIRSAESDEAKAALRKQIDAAAAAFKDGRKPVRMEDRERDDIARVAAFVAGWDGVEYQGKPLEFTHANVCRVLHEQGWIYAQVQKAATDIANFTPR
jgi:hypothetical protein